MYNNKNILVYGLGISGVSIVKALNEMNSNIYVVDGKSEDELKDFLKEIEHIKYKSFLGDKEINLDNIDLLVKSPGIPPRDNLLNEARAKDIKIITDLELAYNISETENFIVVTGTNGKTTTTSLIGDIFINSNVKTYVAGNIGIGIMDYALKAKEDDVILIEASSFQLNDIENFKAKIGLILNLSPDHIDWHGNYEEYVSAKLNLIKNQTKDDTIVLNRDDKRLLDLKDDLKSKVIWFSTKYELENGIFIRDNKIIYRDNQDETYIMNTEDIKLLGSHNLENILGAIGVSISYGINLEDIQNTVKNFRSIEHRLEYVDTINGVSFYNDSKGTNIEATIKAINAMEEPTVLILGGYDKGSEYDDLIKELKDKITNIVVFGQTQDKIIKAAKKHSYKNYHKVNNMKEAVEKSYKLAENKASVLLSPACASWGMYDNYEIRGKDFKNKVRDLKVM